MKTISLLALALVSATASATTYNNLIDFESWPVDWQTPVESPTGSTTGISSSSGWEGYFDWGIYRTSGEGFDVSSLGAFASQFPGDWGNVVLNPFSDYTTDDYFVLNSTDLNQSISELTVHFTDFAQDSDRVELYAYSGLDGTGTLIDSDFGAWGTDSSPNQIAATISGLGIKSVLFRGGDGVDAPNSMYMDNIDVTFEAVPEPGTMAVLGLGVLALKRRRK